MRSSADGTLDCRSVRRRLFTFLSALSLLLCVAVCVLWVRSYRYVSYWDSHEYWTDQGRAHRLESWAVSYRGKFCYAHSALWSEDPLALQLIAKNAGAHGKALDTVADPSWHSRRASTGFLANTRAGFGFESLSQSGAGDLKMSGTRRATSIPYWAMAALTGLPAAMWFRAYRRARRRFRLSLCESCGYDLRATPDRCPECGGGVLAQPAGQE